MKIVLLSFFVLAACSFEHKKGKVANTDGAILLDRPVAYAEVFQTVLGPRCVGCHSSAGGNQGGVNLETYEATVPLALRIEKATVTDKTMPKGQALSDAEMQIIATWLSQGASRNGANRSSAKLRQQIVWSTIKEEIFEKKCLDCHSQPRPEKELDLASFEEVKTHINKIFETAVISQTMPLAPYEQLSLDEKQALAQWIALGMPQ